jgi:hypothetical protein
LVFVDTESQREVASFIDIYLTPPPFRTTMTAMQTLGLSGESKPSDGRLKSIFWPTVQNAWDVDYLGRQGFWICLVIAAFQVVVAAITGNSTLIVTGIAEALVFLIGGLGVRESSWPAAGMVLSIFLLNLIYGMAQGQPPGILAIMSAGILLSNFRAAYLASKWRPAAEDEDRPMRFNETLADKLADQLPAKAWPVLRIPFFVLASILLLLSVAGLSLTIIQHSGFISPAGTG